MPMLGSVTHDCDIQHLAALRAIASDPLVLLPALPTELEG